jgi:L-ribulose-5-phosphate 3-epimerase
MTLEERTMALTNRLAGHTNSYHTYSLDEALEGIAAAGYRYVELTAVRGWTEHISLDADAQALTKVQRTLNRLGLVPVSMSGHSDLTSKEGLQQGKQALDITARLGIDIMSNIGELADYAAKRGIMLGIEIHGDITSSGKKAIPIIQKINRDNVRINYDTANIEFYDNGTKAEDDLPETVPYLVHLHAKDHIGGAREWNFPAPGEESAQYSRKRRVYRADQRRDRVRQRTVASVGGSQPLDEERTRSSRLAWPFVLSTPE